MGGPPPPRRVRRRRKRTTTTIGTFCFRLRSWFGFIWGVLFFRLRRRGSAARVDGGRGGRRRGERKRSGGGGSSSSRKRLLPCRTGTRIGGDGPPPIAFQCVVFLLPPRSPPLHRSRFFFFLFFFFRFVLVLFVFVVVIRHFCRTRYRSGRHGLALCVSSRSGGNEPLHPSLRTAWRCW